MMRRSWSLLPLAFASLLGASVLSAGAVVKAPIVCNRGPDGQTFDAVVTLPAKLEKGAIVTVRVDGVSSGIISHTGLNHIRDMASDFLVPSGTKFVVGSAKLVPGTGTPNVTAGARVWQDVGVIHLLLPAKVPNGGSFTPPSFEFKLEITGAVGTLVALKLWQYRVTANALVVGDLETVCNPTPKPYVMASASVVAPAPSSSTKP